MQASPLTCSREGDCSIQSNNPLTQWPLPPALVWTPAILHELWLPSCHTGLSVS